jgi:FtsP/CotA-like multicopper oxidase with cupredoxin domain
MTALDRRALGLGFGVAFLVPRRAVAQATPEPRTVRLEPGQVQLLPPPAAATEILGFDGLLVGPEIRVRQGEPLRLSVENRLGAPTRLAFPGVAGTAATDIASGARIDLDVSTRDAGTFWFRARALAQRARGLAGLLIVEERVPPVVDRDVVVVVKDLLADPSGRAAGTAGADASRLGLLLTIAGVPQPLVLIARPNERLRLRLVNASVGLVLPVLAPDATLLARDGMPTEAIAPDDLTLAPGNRADLVLDAGTRGTEHALSIALGRQVLPIVMIRSDGEPARAQPLPAPSALPANGIETRLDLARARRATVTIAGGAELTVNGRRGAADRPLVSARRGETLVFTLENRAAAPVVAHVAGHHLRPLDGLDDGWKPWLLDTVLIEPGGRLLAACRAAHHGRWPIELHTAAPQPSFVETLVAVS